MHNEFHSHLQSIVTVPVRIATVEISVIWECQVWPNARKRAPQTADANRSRLVEPHAGWNTMPVPTPSWGTRARDMITSGKVRTPSECSQFHIIKMFFFVKDSCSLRMNDRTIVVWSHRKIIPFRCFSWLAKKASIFYFQCAEKVVLPNLLLAAERTTVSFIDMRIPRRIVIS